MKSERRSLELHDEHRALSRRERFEEVIPRDDGMRELLPEEGLAEASAHKEHTQLACAEHSRSEHRLWRLENLLHELVPGHGSERLTRAKHASLDSVELLTRMREDARGVGILAPRGFVQASCELNSFTPCCERVQRSAARRKIRER